MKSRNRAFAAAITLGCLLLGCTQPSQPEVVVYVSLDEIYAKPLLDRFAEKTGITVRAVYDTEASKTTGLVNRLLAERDRPRADVFWNNEAAQTIRLKEAGALQPYISQQADHYPEQFRDPDGYWHGFAARARVIIYNTELVSNPPDSIQDLADPKWKGQAAIARPLFGTTATHAAALFALWGPERAKQYFESLKQNDVAVLPGNATVRDLVARGQYAFGLTDTDDANGGVLDGFPVDWTLPDQGPEGLGTLLIPNTVMIMAGCPHPEEAQVLVDYVLSGEVESSLASGRSLQIPLRNDVSAPDNVPSATGIRTMPVTFSDVAAAFPDALQYAEESFLE